MKTLVTINRKSINAMVLNNTTAHHADIISNRTGSTEMGMMKSLLIDVLKTKMRAGTAHFFYLKKNGEVREAWGTTSSALMKNKINGNGLSGDEVNCIKYWDCEKGAFRSLRYENLIAVA